MSILPETTVFLRSRISLVHMCPLLDIFITFCELQIRVVPTKSVKFKRETLLLFDKEVDGYSITRHANGYIKLDAMPSFLSKPNGMGEKLTNRSLAKRNTVHETMAKPGLTWCSCRFLQDCFSSFHVV